MKNPGLIKTFDADGAITARRIVKPGSSDGQVTTAEGATDAVLGVSETVDADDGARADIILTGLAQVEYGGSVSAGDPLTSDADGKAVSAAPATDENSRIVGWAVISGDDGDYGSVLLAPGQIQGAA